MWNKFNRWSKTLWFGPPFYFLSVRKASGAYRRRPPNTNTHPSSSSFQLAPLSAGVGSAAEGGRGRAGTKLFQDFQMLSRIWTHPWCLQLDYISKENRVGFWAQRQKSSRKIHLLQNLRTLRKNQGGADGRIADGWMDGWMDGRKDGRKDFLRAIWEVFSLQGFFDEDSMEEFIASDTEESSMSLSSENEKPKKWALDQVHFYRSPVACLRVWIELLHHSCLLGRRSKGGGKRKGPKTPTATTWRSSRSGTPAPGARMGRVATGESLWRNVSKIDAFYSHEISARVPISCELSLFCKW